MKKATRFAVPMLLAFALPLSAAPPPGKPLPGERVGGEGRDRRANKRVDNRLPTRLDTRVQRRTIGRPLLAATSQIISDAENGCARDRDRAAADTAPSAQACQGPR